MAADRRAGRRRRNPERAHSPPPARKPAAAQPAEVLPPQVQGAGAGVVASGTPRRGLPPVPRVPLREVISEETAAKLGFGKSIDGTPVGPDDFASDGSVSFEVKMPQGISIFDLQVDAEVGADRDQVFRITITDREDGGARGIPTRTLMGDPKSKGYQTFKSGVMEFARHYAAELAQRADAGGQGSHPAAVRQHLQRPRARRVRQPREVCAGRQVRLRAHARRCARAKRVDQAWNDLYASFEYHNNYVQMLAQHYKLDLGGKHVSQIDAAQLAAMPAEPRQYIAPLRGRVQDGAWRRRQRPVRGTCRTASSSPAAPGAVR